jgi:hypothetical protein
MKKTTIFLLPLIYLAASTCSQSFDVSLCRNFHEILDLDGNYLKSLCYVNSGKNYTEAFEDCESKGMKLYDVQQTLNFAKLTQFTDTIWKIEQSAIFWAGFSNIECIKVTKHAYKSYSVAKNNCSQGLHYFCEYSRDCNKYQ